MLTDKPVTLQVAIRCKSSDLEALCTGRESFDVVVTSVEVEEGATVGADSSNGE